MSDRNEPQFDVADELPPVQYAGKQSRPEYVAAVLGSLSDGKPRSTTAADRHEAELIIRRLRTAARNHEAVINARKAPLDDGRVRVTFTALRPIRTQSTY